MVGCSPDSQATACGYEGDPVSRTSVIRYRTRPDAAEENVRLVKAVYAALKETRPGDLEYATYRLDDDVTFVHIARLPDTENPLASLPAFAEFQRELAERCVEQPAPSGATIVGSYRARS
jgi:hypothetical protein